MKCPYCDHSEIKVLETREAEYSDVTRRRRECLKCKKRFTTYERVEMLDLRVVKKNNIIETFDRNKLLKGVLRATEKRPIKIEKIERLVDDVETELRKEETTEIPSTVIGEKVMEKLKQLDKIAYIRFASVYRDFTDIKSFEKELNKIKKEGK
jgi:transcriptional repressor NrdR